MANLNNKNEMATRLILAANANSKIWDALSKTKCDKTIQAINRIQRYREAPTFADVELGIDAIKAEATEKLTASCKRIAFIAGEAKKFDKNIVITTSARNEDGSYKKVDSMTNREKLEMFMEYRKLDLLIQQAADELANS